MLIGVAAPIVRMRRRRRQRAGRPIRSLWTGSPILNMAINARCERLLGVDAESLVQHTYHVTSAFDRSASAWRAKPVIGGFVPYVLLVWAALRYDRFHFYCDRGLLDSLEPYRFREAEGRVLRRCGAELCFWTYGADVRTRNRTESLGTWSCCTDCPAPGTQCICDEGRGSASYATVRRYANVIFSMGDMIEYCPGSVTDVFFWPVELDADGGRRYEPHFPDPTSERPVRVVHAPNHRAFKGTRFLEAAVEQLQAEGVPIELVLVEKKPNDEALAIYRTADIVFDQCLVGFHGYFAQEAMALGKPVVCFIRDPDRYLLSPAECPIVDVTPERVADVLRDLAADRQRLHDLGVAGRRYIERYHVPERFAERLGAALERAGLASGPAI